MSGDRNNQKDRDRESRRILDRVERDSQALGGETVNRIADQARDHFGGADADPDDRIEVWGRRIGRGLSVAAFIVLAIWLFNFLNR